MIIQRVGLIGWRGMVGSVLMQRMHEENDFHRIPEPIFFSTSQAGCAAPMGAKNTRTLQDAYDIIALSRMDAIISCQGSAYTKKVFPRLRKYGWKGYWIDAASHLRMHPNTVIALDPINHSSLHRAIDQGVNTFTGGNCTVSLMLMAIGCLLQHDAVEWISTMTYQAASGAGAKHMRELLTQMGQMHQAAAQSETQGARDVLTVDAAVNRCMRSQDFATHAFSAPLAGSLIPWIDDAHDGGRTKEEWKSSAEANKILGKSSSPIPIDGTCVRVGAMRCHSQALTIKLKEAIPIVDVEGMIRNAHPWSEVIPNDATSTRKQLTPSAVQGSLQIAIGRLRPMQLGPQFINAFTVGDQLLWGAAEPLRRLINILLASKHINSNNIHSASYCVRSETLSYTSKPHNSKSFTTKLNPFTVLLFECFEVTTFHVLV